MSNRTITLTDELQAYLLANSLREPELLRRLRRETATLPEAQMQIAPEQGQFMSLLVRLSGARKTIEIGTFTGYSALCVAQALPPDGRVVCCDISEQYTAIARRYWQEAGLAERIELHVAPARETLGRLLSAGEASSFDFGFIDADKESYDHYYEAVLDLLRPGGLVAIDNVLWNGAVADPARTDKDTIAIRALNAKIAGDERVDCSLVPIGDGLMLARKR